MKGVDFSTCILIKQFMIKHPGYAVYVLVSLKDQQFYIGFTSDFKRRMEEHEEGNSKSTACRRPFICLFVEYYFSKKDVMRHEEYYNTSAGKSILRLMLQESLLEQRRKIHLIINDHPNKNFSITSSEYRYSKDRSLADEAAKTF